MAEPGSRSAPGGQLVQSTDHYVGVRNACLVLVDDNNSVRARVTASWLLQMGWKDVYVLRDALHPSGVALLRGPEPVHVLGDTHLANVDWIGVVELQGLLARQEAVVVDLDTSLAYRKSHIPGAWFAVRSRLASSLRKLPPHRVLVLTSEDGAIYRALVAKGLRPVARSAHREAGGARSRVALAGARRRDRRGGLARGHRHQRADRRVIAVDEPALDQPRRRIVRHRDPVIGEHARRAPRALPGAIAARGERARARLAQRELRAQAQGGVLDHA